MKKRKSLYHGHRFPAVVISCAVRWYFRFSLSLRDIEELLQHGAELDVLVQKRRDKAAAKRFFRRVLRSNPVPRKIVTDQLRSYPAAMADIPELAHVKHVFVKAPARVNNRAENSHQPTRRRERQMCGFRDALRTQAFLLCFGPIRQHFALPRHQMNAACHRATLKERFTTWHSWTVTGAFEKVV